MKSVRAIIETFCFDLEIWPFSKVYFLLYAMVIDLIGNKHEIYKYSCYIFILEFKLLL